MSARTSSSHKGTTRRAFQHATLLAVPLIYGLGLAVGAIRYLMKPLAGKKRLPKLDLGLKSDLIEAGPRRVGFNDHEVHIIPNETGDDLVVRKATCPHLGCVVGWFGEKGEFQCPCHGQIFSREGIAVTGPTNKPLSTQDYTETEDGRIVLLDDEA